MSSRISALAVASLTVSCAGTTHTQTRRDGFDVHTFTRANSSAHLVVKGDELVLIDSGYESEAQGLETALSEAGFPPEKVKAVIITHAHADHAGGARLFQEKHHVKVLGGAGDTGMFSSGKNEPVCPTDLLGRLRQREDVSATYTAYTPDVLVSESLPLNSVAGIEGSIIPLPGHTKGSLVVTVGDVAFVGDLFRGSLVGSSAQRHLYMCDIEGNTRDIGRLLKELAPTAKVFFVGHFGPVSRESVAERFGID